MTAQVDDGPLAVAQRRFVDNVHAFVDRIPIWDGAVCRWQPALYSRVRSALSEKSLKSGRRIMPGSKSPCRTSCLDWLREVDATVGTWGPGGGTMHTLRLLAGRSWRPQDCGLLDDWSGRLAVWSVEASTLLHDAVVVVPLRGIACPACGGRWAYRRRDGETVRTPALTVSELGAECQLCSATWTTDQFEFLAKLITA